MINHSKLSSQNSVLFNDITSNQFTSKPGKLLKRVETCMLESLQYTSKTQLASSKIIQQAAVYHLQSGGQRFRAQLALNAGEALGVDEKNCVLVAAVVELLHNASLIHDDLQDGDYLRRGREAVWIKFGSNLAICCGDLYLSAAYAVLARVDHSSDFSAMFKLVHQRVAEAIHGQSEDLTTAPDQIKLETYIDIVMAKSGALLSLPLELTFLLSNLSNTLYLVENACKNFAVAFQIYDDLKDFSVDCTQVGKLPTKSTAKSATESDRLNIITVLKHTNIGQDNSFNPITASKDIAIDYLTKAEALLIQLPSHSGRLLQEYAQHIRRVLEQYSFQR